MLLRVLVPDLEAQVIFVQVADFGEPSGRIAPDGLWIGFMDWVGIGAGSGGSATNASAELQFNLDRGGR